ncbi:diacylglycerol/lipid kinase family protein [Streptomyces poonensis]|uniref:Diacylglycerol kinase n=1 Tax=Streptomyces poonensis TaxID=68255 RepID=A0A918PZK9_9ACTN|nr:diacylglycerol kinase family protein [Streptomyces poonensis]GGZ28478.1 diacylglycerol kinase [Streptomyces poonensis]GLJ89841.1 diacylglycerol kinase [Streptomyces poonensis]
MPYPAVPACPAPTRALIVVNPAAGGHRADLVERLASLCRERLASVAVLRTTGPGDAVDAVHRAVAKGTVEHRPDLVVAAGGDGTVREAAEGLVRQGGEGRGDAALLIVPWGSANSGYRMFWDDRPWRDAVSMVLEPGRAEVRRMDLARLAETGDHVLLGSCTGLGAQILPALAAVPAGSRGRDRYARALAAVAADFRPYPGRVTVDGTVLAEGPTVLANVGGGRYRAGQYLLLPHSRPDDGLLDVCVIGGRTDPARVPELTRHAGHLGEPGTAYGRGRRVVVERLDGEGLVLEHDGEPRDGIGSTATFDVVPGALPVWTAPAGR